MGRCDVGLPRRARGARRPSGGASTSYDAILQRPAREAGRIARFADLSWDERAADAARRVQRTVDSPEPRQWLHNAKELDAVWGICDPVARRAHELFAEPPATQASRPPTTSNLHVPEETEPDDRSGGFTSVHTASFPELLHRLGITVLVSTYQSGRLIALRSDGAHLNTHFRTFGMPMGIAVDERRLALGTRTGVWEYRNQPAVAAKLAPEGRHDAAYLPRRHHVTGEIQVHEVGYCGDELWLVATRFSCLATIDREHSFVPRWRPPFVSKIAAEDRCHLNGMAIVDDEVRYVTAMDRTDTIGGWRERKATHGVVLDVASGEVVTAGLSMPHSPPDARRPALGALVGPGRGVHRRPVHGDREVVAKLPGFTRGLAFAGPYAFVGLSQVRESVFGGIPLADELDETERKCGVWVLDTRTGETVAFLRFEGIVQELFDVQVLSGLRWPEAGRARLQARRLVLRAPGCRDARRPQRPALTSSGDGWAWHQRTGEVPDSHVVATGVLADEHETGVPPDRLVLGALDPLVLHVDHGADTAEVSAAHELGLVVAPALVQQVGRHVAVTGRLDHEDPQVEEIEAELLRAVEHRGGDPDQLAGGLLRGDHEHLVHPTACLLGGHDSLRAPRDPARRQWSGSVASGSRRTR